MSERSVRPARRPQDLQALRRRRVPALRERPVLRGDRRARAASWPTPRWPPARTPATPSSRPARRSPAGRPRRRTTAARSSTASPRCSRAAAASSSRRSRPARALRAQGRGRRRRGDRPLGLVRRLDRQDRPGRRRRPTRSRAVLQLLASRSRPASSRSSRRRSRRCSGWCRVLAPVIVTGNTAVVLASEQRPLPAVTLAEVLATSDVPGGVVNVLTGRTAEIAPWLASHMDVNAIDLAGRRRRRGRGPARSRPPTTSSASLRPEADRLGRRPGAAADAGVPGDEDRLAPDRRLTAGGSSAAGGPRRADRRSLRVGQDPSRRGVRPAAAGPRRLLQGRRRPDAAASPDSRHRRLGPPCLVGHAGRHWPRSRRSAATAPVTCRSTTWSTTPGSAHAASTCTARRRSSAPGSSPPSWWHRRVNTDCWPTPWCVRRSRSTNFLRRLRRDLAEHRDPPLTLVRRGLTQLRAEPSVVARQMSLGCRPCDRAGTLAALRAAAQAGRPDNRPAR